MPTLAAIAALLLSPAALLAQVPAPPRPYTQLFVFGDSYSDTGAGFLYSDGPTAVAYLAQRLGIPLTYYGAPAGKSPSINFAVSGARTGEDPGEHEGHAIFRLGMKNQVDEFAALLRSGDLHFDPAQTMFFLAGGLNDSRTADGYTRANLEAEIDTLYDLGARRFQVALLPVQIPEFDVPGTRFNPDLARIPADERTRHPGLQIANSRWGPFLDEVRTHPDQYGLADVTLTCGDARVKAANPAPCASANHFYFYPGHPSTAVHKAVGDMLYTEALQQATPQKTSPAP